MSVRLTSARSLSVRLFSPQFLTYRSMSRWHLLALVAMLALVPLAAACGSDEESEDREITFMAGFRPQANLPFAAVYVAEAEGFFAEEGLKVNIQHSSGQDEHLKLLVDGTVHFTTSTAAQVIRLRAEDLPVRAIALFGQRGDQGYVARADSGIAHPRDFVGKSVGFKAGVVPAELVAMLAGAGVTTDQVDLVSVGFDPRVFIEGAVDIYPVFLNNEPDTIQRAGVEINIIDPHDHGVPTLGLTFLTTDSTIANDPELVERFLRATIKATAWIDEHRDEAIAIVLRHADGADAEHQRYLLNTDLAAAQREDGRGRSTIGQWASVADLLLSHGVISAPVPLETVVEWGILERLYQAGAIQ